MRSKILGISKILIWFSVLLMKGIISVSLAMLIKISIWLVIVCAFGFALLLAVQFSDFCAFYHELENQIATMPKGGVRVPANDDSGSIFVEGTINGKRHVKLLVDTGSGGCVIDRSLVNELHRSWVVPIVVNTPTETQLLESASIQKLEIGGLVFRSVPVQIGDLCQVSLQTGHQVDGILGNVILNHFATTFDSHNKVIIFEANDKFAFPAKGFKIECVKTGGIQTVTATIAGKLKQSFDVDTGAQWSLLPKKVQRKLALQVTPGVSMAYMSSTPQKQGQVKISEFDLGELKIEDMWFNVDLTSDKADNTALLGYDFLKKFRFTLVPEDQVLILKPYKIYHAEMLEDQARHLIAVGKCAQALNMVDRDVRSEPKNHKLRMLRADLLYRMKRYRECVKETTLCIKASSAEQELYLLRAEAYKELGDRNVAVQDILKVPSMYPADPFVLLRCGMALSDLLANQQAISLFNKALKMRSDIFQIYFARAVAYKNIREYKKALDDCDTAIRVNPNVADSFSLRAWVRNAIGQDFDKSIEDCNRAITIDQNCASAYRNRAIAYIGKSNYSNAMLDLNKSLTLDSSSERGGKTYYFRSVVYKKLDKKDLADQDEKRSKQFGYDPNKD